jgi:hypothetical protein
MRKWKWKPLGVAAVPAVLAAGAFVWVAGKSSVDRPGRKAVAAGRSRG